MKLDLKKNNNKKYYIQKWTAVESVESEASSRLEIASPCFRDEACPNLPHFISAKFKESASRDMIHLRFRTYKSDVLDLWWCNDARKFKWYDGDLIWYFFFVSRSSQTKALISSFLHVLLDEVCLSFKPQPPRRIWEKREAMFVGLIKLNSHVIRLPSYDEYMPTLLCSLFNVLLDTPVRASYRVERRYTPYRYTCKEYIRHGP